MGANSMLIIINAFRSLGRYSSEEESDADVKATKSQKNRRATMAAPVSSSTVVTRKSVVEPNVRFCVFFYCSLTH